MRPDQRHLADMRDELHAIVSQLIDAYSQAHQITHDYARGYPTSSGGGSGGSGGWSDPTFAAATTPGADPAAVARKLIAQIDGWLQHGRQAVGTWTRLDIDTRPLTQAQRDKAGERTNTIEVCALCGQPNPKMHRVDGLPYCKSPCYFKVWRTRTPA